MSNTSTTKTAGNNAGAAEEIAVNKTVNGKPAKCKIESADKERRERQFRRMAADGYTVEKAAEATQTEKEATPHTGNRGIPEQQSEAAKEKDIFFHVYSELINSKYFTEKDQSNILEFFLKGKKKTLCNLREFIQNKDSFSEEDKCRYLQFINDSERKYKEEAERNKLVNDYINIRKMKYYGEFFNVGDPIYSGVEMKQITEDVINTTFNYVVNDLLKLLINDACFEDSASTICCIFADYMKKSKTGKVA